MTTMSAELSGYLRTELRQRGWSERRLAREAGISLSALQNILNDERTLPTLTTLGALARALGVRLGRLIELLGYAVDVDQQRADILRALTSDDMAILESLSTHELREVLEFVRRLRGV